MKNACKNGENTWEYMVILDSPKLTMKFLSMSMKPYMRRPGRIPIKYYDAYIATFGC